MAAFYRPEYVTCARNETLKLGSSTNLRSIDLPWRLVNPFITDVFLQHNKNDKTKNR